MKKILSFISFLCMMGYCADIAYAEETSDVPVETTVTEQTTVQSEETTQSIPVFTYPPEITDNFEITTEHIPVENIVVSDFNYEMYIGDIQNISATVIPMTATDTALTYSSSDSSVATVDPLGKITAINSGQCTIAVETAEFINYLHLSVKVKTAEISVDKNFITLKPGDTYQINATAKPGGADSFFTYKSSDDRVISVDGSGMITANSTGSGVIIISNSDAIASINVIVNDEVNKADREEPTKEENLDNKDDISAKIGGSEEIVTLSDVDIITEDMLRALYGTPKKLVVKCDGYDIEICGNDILNIENEINTDILLSKKKSGKEFTLNDENKLPGKLTIRLNDDAKKYRYVYMYNEDNENPRMVNAFTSSGQIEIDSNGKYFITDKKISQHKISVTAVCVVLIILIMLSGVYIFVKKRYWFW